MPVNTGLTDRHAKNPRKHWAGGQPLRKRPFYAGCEAGRRQMSAPFERTANGFADFSGGAVFHTPNLPAGSLLVRDAKHRKILKGKPPAEWVKHKRAGQPQRSAMTRRPEARVFWAFQPGRFWNPCQSGVCRHAGRKCSQTVGLQAGKSGTPVNTGLTDRHARNPRKHWAGGQPLRKRPFYAGCGAGGVACLRSQRLFGR